MVYGIISYRGGTGKSLLALNLSAALAMKIKTILIEADFLAPSLKSIVAKEILPNKYWNDFLLQKCKSSEIITKLQVDKDHKLKIVLTNKDDSEILKFFQNDKKWSIFSRQILKFLLEEIQQKSTTVIIDNQAGLFLSTLAHCFFVDKLIVVIRPDRTAINNTIEYLKIIEKPFYIVWNFVLTETDIDDVIHKWTLLFENVKGYLGTLGKIPIDQKMAYKRWVDGEIIIKDTKYSDEITRIVTKLIGDMVSP